MTLPKKETQLQKGRVKTLPYKSEFEERNDTERRRCVTIFDHLCTHCPWAQPTDTGQYKMRND